MCSFLSSFFISPPSSSFFIPHRFSWTWTADTTLAVYFDRSPETNEVLWFAAPPLHVARAPVVKHSLAYLAYLAGKRKEAEGAGASGGGDGMDVDGEADNEGESGDGDGEAEVEAEGEEKAQAKEEEGKEESEDKDKDKDKGKGKRQRVRVVPTVSEMMQAAMDIVPL